MKDNEVLALLKDSEIAAAKKIMATQAEKYHNYDIFDININERDCTIYFGIGESGSKFYRTYNGNIDHYNGFWNKQSDYNLALKIVTRMFKEKGW